MSAAAVAPTAGADAGERVVVQSSTSQVTIQGPVTSVSSTPYFHVVATISGKGNVSIYSSYLTKAKAGDVVKATGFYNSLGNFQASSAAIVTSNAATPTPGPTAKPTATPTAKPTAAPTVKPTAVPTVKPTIAPTAPPPSSGSGIAGAINLFQIFDYNTTAAQSTAAAKGQNAVWGAGVGAKGASPTTWSAGNPNLVTIQYIVQPTDYNPISGHSVTWFQANHPDWIVYDCDANNQPTHTVAYEPSLPKDVPLDIHNPEVVKYQIQMAGKFAISRGANAIGADQTLFFDYDGGQQPGWYGCGIYQNGTFVRRWGAPGGGFPNHDPQWNHDVAAWVVQAKQILNTDATLAPYHLKLFVNHPASSVSNPDEQTLIANVDGILDETGFVDYGHYPQVPGLFRTALSYMQYVQQHGKLMLETAKFSGSLNGDSSNFGLTTEQVAYAMGSYLIGNEGRSSLFITPGPYGTVYNFPQVATINSGLGNACSSYTTLGAAYVRKFQHGLVIANPSTASVAIPLGGVYTDAMGRAITGTTLTVSPANAYILLGGGGC